MGYDFTLLNNNNENIAFQFTDNRYIVHRKIEYTQKGLDFVLFFDMKKLNPRPEAADKIEIYHCTKILNL